MEREQPRLDLDSALSWMRRSGTDRIMWLGVEVTPAGARLLAERLVELATEIETEQAES